MTLYAVRHKATGELMPATKRTEIPKIVDDFDHGPEYAGKPGWMQPTRDGKKLKPVIRCNCGWYCGIGLHTVHADGTVTASFFHTASGPNGDPERGCEWHVWLKLLDYDGGAFPGRQQGGETT